MNELGLGLTIACHDAFSATSKRIQNQMRGLSSVAEATRTRLDRSMNQIAKGGMIAGAGAALAAVPAMLLKTTVPTQKALGELASVGITDMQALSDAAVSFSNDFSGTTKAQFLSAAYDIKSGISSLSDHGVAEFSRIAALTAKATKATAENMTSLFATAYSTMREARDTASLSDTQWAEAFSGGIATAVETFKTTGPEIQAAMSNLANIGTSLGMSSAEQIAMLGIFQSNWGGAEAGTKGKQWIEQLYQAQEKSGLKLSNDQGMLPVVEVLKTLEGRLGDLGSGTARLKLAEWFGSKEAVEGLTTLYDKMDVFQAKTAVISQAMGRGTAATQKMAMAMNRDIGATLQIMGQRFANLAEEVGTVLIPIFQPLIRGVSTVFLGLQKLAKANPFLIQTTLGLAGVVGLMAATLGGATVALGALGMVLPAAQAGLAFLGIEALTVSGIMSGLTTAVASAGATIYSVFWPVTLAIGAIVGSVLILRKVWSSNFAGIQSVVKGFFGKIKLVFDGVRSLVATFNGSTGAMSADLAERLESVGLLKFVGVIFRAYARVKSFVTGFTNALSVAFAGVRESLEPAIKSLGKSVLSLFGAFKPLLTAFGLMSKTGNMNTFENLGMAIGATIGTVAELGAFLLKFIIYPISWAVRIVGALGKALSYAFSATILTPIMVPVWAVVKAFQAVGWVVGKIGQGFSALAGIATSAFTAIKDSVASVFSGGALWGAGKGLVVSLAKGIWASATWPVQAITGVIKKALSVFGTDFSFAEAGKKIILTFVDGIKSVTLAPFKAVKNVLGKVRNLLPFSDAKEGPLSSLTASGSAMLDAFSGGIKKAASGPREALGKALGWVGKGLAGLMPQVDLSLVPKALTATLLLTPVLTATPGLPGQTTDISIMQPSSKTRETPVSSSTGFDGLPQPVMPAQNREAGPAIGDLLSEQRQIRILLTEILNEARKGDGKPVQIEIDGRKVAETVNRHNRESLTRRYETL